MAYTPTTWVDGSEPAITATRLNNMETGIYQAHELLDTVTSAATADALVKRDSAGRAKFAQGASTGDAVVYPVPVTSLKRAQGSAQTAGAYAVHQYAFASPTSSGDVNFATGVVIGAQNPNTSGPVRLWAGVGNSDANSDWGGGSADILFANGSSLRTRTWDYLTASGHPRVWAEVDERGEIVAIWEAEDPADPEFPDEPPFEPREGRVLVPVEPPDSTLLDAVAQRLDQATTPHGFRNSIYAADPPPRAAQAMLSRQLAERGLEEPHDIREALSIADRDRRYWYLQLYMRQASRLLHDHRASTLIPLYREMCRVDKRTGRLALK